MTASNLSIALLIGTEARTTFALDRRIAVAGARRPARSFAGLAARLVLAVRPQASLAR